MRYRRTLAVQRCVLCVLVCIMYVSLFRDSYSHTHTTHLHTHDGFVLATVFGSKKRESMYKHTRMHTHTHTKQNGTCDSIWAEKA